MLQGFANYVARPPDTTCAKVLTILHVGRWLGRLRAVRGDTNSGTNKPVRSVSNGCKVKPTGLKILLLNCGFIVKCDIELRSVIWLVISSQLMFLQSLFSSICNGHMIGRSKGLCNALQCMETSHESTCHVGGCRESINGDGGGALVESARFTSVSPNVRIEKDGAEDVRLPPAVGA